MKKCLVILFIICLFLSGVLDVFAANHQSDFNKLNDYFEHSDCLDNNSCKNNAEYKFYLKMFDLYYLYRIKYNVKLDLPLLMSTLSYDSDDNFFKKNVSDYDRKTIVESDWNPSSVTELDWDYDYESQPNYLVSNDSTWDMQVLAKNMVSKTTVQRCLKDGNVVKTQNVKDYEEDLVCGEGETFEVGSSSYKLDKDKYKDFLLEYLEKKFFLGRIVYNPTYSKGPNYVNRNKFPNVKRSTSFDSTKTEQAPISATGIEAIDKLTTIGKAEVGNIGYKYRSWYNGGSDWHVDWCAIFVSWLFNQINGLGKYDVMTAGAGDHARLSVAKGYGVWYESEYSDSSTVPRAGDIVVFTWNGIGHYPGQDAYYSDHVGYVYAVDDAFIYTIEGNTGSYDNDTSTVMLKKYDRKSGNINGYYRPNY